MLDLHCHILPAVDDGAKDMATAVKMAEMAADDGITCIACTPHIYPGWFENTATGISEGVVLLQEALATLGVSMQLVAGADIQAVPDLVAGLQSGRLPTINGSRYFLFEPPHNTRLPGIEKLLYQALLHGYIPVITHPERLAYIDRDYELFAQAARNGAWIQLTGGSLLGNFGSKAKKYSERFLEDGLVHLLASDGHNLDRRAPVLSKAKAAAGRIVGDEESSRLVIDRPEAVLANEAPESVVLPAAMDAGVSPSNRTSGGWLSRLFNR